MGDVAASGGYMAAMRADVIVAQPTTITASIGVFGIWPVATGLLASLGVNVERLSVGTNAGMYSVFQPPTSAQRTAIQRQLDEIYADFTRQVGEARKLEGGRLDAAARGRVFSGIDAKKAGLIDELGGLQLALSIAKAKGGIDEQRQVELPPPRPIRPLQKVRIACGGWPASTPKGRRASRAGGERSPLRHRRRPGNVRLPPLPRLAVVSGHHAIGARPSSSAHALMGLRPLRMRRRGRGPERLERCKTHVARVLACLRGR